MKAIVFNKYGPPDVLQLAEIETPEVKDNQVLVRVRAAAVNPVDWHHMRGQPYIFRLVMGLGKPRTNGLGADVAGEIQAVGRDVTQFRPGDEVFGMSIATCAEYVAVSEVGLTRKPAGLTFEQAAAVPLAASTALQGLRDKGQIRPGHKVLINGASGGVGTFAVQIAKELGAEVTGVCSTRNVDLVRSLGADQVFDYSREDFTRSGRRYNLILDNVGTHSWSEYRRVLGSTGILVAVGSISKSQIAPLALPPKLVLSRIVGPKVVFFLTKRSQEDLVLLKELIESGKVTPVIDRRYTLREVPDAIRYLEEGHARGKVVITV